VWKPRARGWDTDRCGYGWRAAARLGGPFWDPVHGCVRYQEEALLTAAAEGCVRYQEEALLTTAAEAADALSYVHSRLFESSDPEVETVTGVDVVDEQLRGSVDTSGTPLHGCVEPQERALLAAATGVVEALPGVDSQVYEASDPEVGMVTGVDMANNQLRGLVDPSGTPRHGCVEYQEEDLLAKKIARRGCVSSLWP